jgi:ribonuclease HII
MLKIGIFLFCYSDPNTMVLKVRFGSDESIEMGVDEAGRGCLWGPLYAGAVIWTPEEEWTEDHREISPMIKDSKQLSEKKREFLANAIQSLAIGYGVGSVSAGEIDSIGMSAANRLAFQRAIQANPVPPDRLLIDGCLPLLEDSLEEVGANEQQTIVEGDSQYIPIAAASILAKHARDSWVKTYVIEHPQLEEFYNLLSNKGYGTQKHREGILKHGMDNEHRRLFLRKLLGKSKCEIEDDD